MRMRLIVTMLSCLAVWGLACGANALAAVSGPCSDCHTMHNSQDGADMGLSTPQGHLTLNSCIGCHTGTGVGNAPLVDGRYNVDSRAGGTFKDSGTAGEVAATDACVHNVNVSGLLSTLGEDDDLSTIPGLTGGMNGGRGSSTPSDLTCAGKNGCHGDSNGDDNDAGIQGFHHGSKTGYRYLWVAGTDVPVLGVGAADWELAMSNGWNTGEEHNVYSSSPTQGINKLCANCHPNFHSTANTQSGVNWIRHPTDNTLPGTWTPTVNYRENPFAFADVSSLTAAGTYTATDAQVACISCHRAHGSPYDDLLRWAYTTQDAGSGATYGCLGCHNKQR